ncbi:MAG: hypothetical protein WA709_23905, partial [Stellaceae bacterium]
LVLRQRALSVDYAGRDQGNRLEWFNSGVVCGLLLAGIAFLVHEADHPRVPISSRVCSSGCPPHQRSRA